MEILKALGLEWKILLGQMVNFLILLYLFKRFVFGRFLEILQKRQTKIKKGIEKAKLAEAKIKEIKEKRDQILKKAKEKAILLMKEQKNLAQKKREELLKLAEKEREKIIFEAKKEAKREIEKEKMLFQKELLDLTFLLVEKILREKIDKEKDQELLEKTLKTLNL